VPLALALPPLAAPLAAQDGAAATGGTGEPWRLIQPARRPGTPMIRA
jgi:hypothetical protein